ncbi:hypothetical protein TRVL_09802 [Trypanosoma vivax]|nr:hypothetical protein TRVL_09802 [Trypanosoma vivax]
MPSHLSSLRLATVLFTRPQFVSTSCLSPHESVLSCFLIAAKNVLVRALRFVPILRQTTKLKAKTLSFIFLIVINSAICFNCLLALFACFHLRSGLGSASRAYHVVQVSHATNKEAFLCAAILFDARTLRAFSFRTACLSCFEKSYVCTRLSTPIHKAFDTAQLPTSFAVDTAVPPKFSCAHFSLHWCFKFLPSICYGLFTCCTIRQYLQCIVALFSFYHCVVVAALGHFRLLQASNVSALGLC